MSVEWWIFKSKEEKDIDELNNYLNKNAVPEVRKVWELWKKGEMDINNKYVGLRLLKSINDRWPPKNDEEKVRFARQLMMLKDKLPELKQLAYETSLKGILIDTWKLTAKQINEATKKTFNVFRYLTPILILGGAYLGYRFVKGKVKMFIPKKV